MFALPKTNVLGNDAVSVLRLRGNAMKQGIKLAQAVQRFRNLPQFRNALKLRGTKEYADLCDAWDDFVHLYPEARLQNVIRLKGEK